MADTRNNGAGFPVGSMVKNLAINAGDMGSIPGLVRSLQEEMATCSSIFAGKIRKSHGERSLVGYSP